MIKDFFKKYTKKKLIKGFATLIIYFLWVIWIENYWFFLGLPIVFDMTFTRKVNWSPWKKREGKNHVLIEWLDALIFAVIAVSIINVFLFQMYKIPTGSMEKTLRVNDHLFVSKTAYGPRIPNTPLSLPFMHNTIPGLKTKSFIEWPKWGYKRIKGFGHVKRWDPVVFNFPAGDTVVLQNPNVSYYSIVRDEMFKLMRDEVNSGKTLKNKDFYYSKARKIVWDYYGEENIVVRPVDKRDNYIKRCVALPGDTLKIINGVLYINGKEEPYFEGRQFQYLLNTQGRTISKRFIDELEVYDNEVYAPNVNNPYYTMFLSEKSLKKVKEKKLATQIEPLIYGTNMVSNEVFPFDTTIYKWNIDQYGPLWIPKKGVTVELNAANLPIYKRIIECYEKNELKIDGDKIYINGELANSYTFKMDYYWMMGDNRHNSLDSRIWGFVPEDHIVGKPKFIWLAADKDKSFPSNIQFKRMFRKIK